MGKHTFRLPGSDFREPPEPKSQAITLFCGDPGAGKTTLGVDGAPDPIAYFDFDLRGRHAVKKARAKGKTIGHLEIGIPKGIMRKNDAFVMKYAKNQVHIFEKNMERAVEGSKKELVRTIVIDTITEMETVYNFAVAGRADRKNDDFGKSTRTIKTAMSNIIKLARDGNANLIMLARAKDLYEGRDNTGKRTWQGADLFGYEADFAGWIRFQPMVVEVGAGKSRHRIRIKKRATSTKREIEIVKDGVAGDQLNQVYTQDDWEKAELDPFVYCCYQNFPDSDVEDWM